jgi:hypothetical protein
MWGVPLVQEWHCFTMMADVPSISPALAGNPQPHQPELAHSSAALINEPLP